MELNGLSDETVKINRKKYGSNQVENTKSHSFFSLFIESFGDPIIKILLIALVVKVVLLFRDFDWFETLGILIAVFLASFIFSKIMLLFNRKGEWYAKNFSSGFRWFWLSRRRIW